MVEGLVLWCLRLELVGVDGLNVEDRDGLVGNQESELVWRTRDSKL
jgi:hypothetical protein